jgi:hypothetical protein
MSHGQHVAHFSWLGLDMIGLLLTTWGVCLSPRGSEVAANTAWTLNLVKWRAAAVLDCLREPHSQPCWQGIQLDFHQKRDRHTMLYERNFFWAECIARLARIISNQTTLSSEWMISLVHHAWPHSCRIELPNKYCTAVALLLSRL